MIFNLKYRNMQIKTKPLIKCLLLLYVCLVGRYNYEVFMSGKKSNQKNIRYLVLPCNTRRHYLMKLQNFRHHWSFSILFEDPVFGTWYQLNLFKFFLKVDAAPKIWNRAKNEDKYPIKIFPINFFDKGLGTIVEKLVFFGFR